MARKKKKTLSREEQFRRQEQRTRQRFQEENPAEYKLRAAHDRWVEEQDEYEEHKKQQKKQILKQGDAEQEDEKPKQPEQNNVHMPWDDKLLSPEQKTWENFKNGGAVQYLKDHYKSGFVVDDTNTDQYDPQMASTIAGSTALRTAKPTLRDVGHIDTGLLSDFYKFKAEREKQYKQYVSPATSDDNVTPELDDQKTDLSNYLDQSSIALRNSAYVARPANYGTAEWFRDAYTTHQIAMNEGQSQIFEGKKIRLQEFEDMRKAADDALIRQEKANAIERWLKAKKNLETLSSNANPAYEARLLDEYNKAQQEVAKIVGPNFNNEELEEGYNYYLFNHAVDDAKAVKAMEYLPLGSYYRKLTRMLHKGEGKDRAGNLHGNFMGHTDDWFGDDVYEAADYLQGYTSMTKEERAAATKQFQDESKRNMRYYDYMIEQNNKEARNYAKEHRVSDYFKYKAATASDDWWDIDNIAYKNIQQMGYSNSSWDKQLVSMAGKIVATVATGNPYIAAAGALIGGAGEYASGVSENNQEIAEQYKSRYLAHYDELEKSLQGRIDPQCIADIKQQLIKDGHEDVLQNKDFNIKKYAIYQILTGQYVPKDNSTQNAIKDALDEYATKIRQGADVEFSRNQVAVAQDALNDVLIYGPNKAGILMTGAYKGTSKALGLVGVRMPDLPGKIGGWIASKKATAAAYAKKHGLDVAFNRFKAGYGFAQPVSQGVGAVVGTAYAVTGAAKDGLKKSLQGTIAQHAWQKSKAIASQVGDVAKSSLSRAAQWNVSQTAKQWASVPYRSVMKHVSDNTKLAIAGTAKRRGKALLDFAKQGAVSAYSEEIEEAKQFMNGQEWIRDLDAKQYEGILERMWHDASLGTTAMLPALGVPFGIRFGLTKNDEAYASMSGALIGSTQQHAAITTIGHAISELGDIAFGIQTNKVDQIIRESMVAGIHGFQNQYVNTTQLANAAQSDPSKLLARFEEMKKLNAQRKAKGVSGVYTDEELKQSEDYIKKVINTVNNSQVQAAAANQGIKKGTEEYGKYIASVVHAQEQLDDLRKANPINQRAMSDIATSVEQAIQQQAADDFNNAMLEGEEGNAEISPAMQFQDNVKKAVKGWFDKIQETAGINGSSKMILDDKKSFQSGIRDLLRLRALRQLKQDMDAITIPELFKHDHDSNWTKEQVTAEIERLENMYSQKEDRSDVNELLSQLEQIVGDELDDVNAIFRSSFAEELELKTAKELMDALLGNANNRKRGFLDKLFSIKKKDATSRAKQIIDLYDKNVQTTNDYDHAVRMEIENSAFRQRAEERIQRAIERAEQEVQDDTKAAQQAAVTHPEQPSAQPQQAPSVQPAQQPTVQPQVQPSQTQQQPQQSQTSKQPETPVQQPATQPEKKTSPQADEQKGNAAKQYQTKQPEQKQQYGSKNKVFTEDKLKEALAKAHKLRSNLNSGVNPEWLEVGITIMGYHVEAGIRKFGDVVAQTCRTLKESGFSDAAVRDMSKMFKQWYAATIQDDVFANIPDDELSSRSEVANTDVPAIVEETLDDVLVEEIKEAIVDDFVEQAKIDNGAKAAVTTLQEAQQQHVSSGDKIAVVNRDTKDVLVLTATEVTKKGTVKTAVDENGNVYIKNSHIVSAKQRAGYTQHSGNNAQQSIWEKLKAKITEDNEQVIGHTVYHYLVRAKDGSVKLYKRVHTVLGPQYEEMRDISDDIKKARENVLAWVQNPDGVTLNVTNPSADKDTSIKMYREYFIDKDAQNIPEEVIDALVEICVSDTPGVAVDLGNVVDDMGRIIFNSDPDLMEPLDYDSYQIDFNGVKIPVSQIMSRNTFSAIVTDMIEFRDAHNGWMFSTQKHTWFGEIYVNGQLQSVAGETDIVAIDENDKMHILDFKTSRHSFKSQKVVDAEGNEIEAGHFESRNDFGTKRARFSAKEQYTRQLNAYRLLIMSAMPDAEFADSPLEIVGVVLDYNVANATNKMSDLKAGKSQSYDSYVGLPLSYGHMDRDNNGIMRIELPVLPTITNEQEDPDALLRKQREQLEEQLNELDEQYQIGQSYKVQEVEDLPDWYDDHNNGVIPQTVQQLLQQLREAYSQFQQQRDKTDDSTIDGLNKKIELYQQILARESELCDAILDAHEQEKAKIVKQEDAQTAKDSRVNALIQSIQNFVKAVVNAVQVHGGQTTRSEYELLIATYDSLLGELEQNQDLTQDQRAELEQQLESASQQMSSLTPPAKKQNSNKRRNGWILHNTLDRSGVMSSYATDDDSLKLSDVVTEPEFETESVCEVISEPSYINDGVMNVMVSITYHGHTYSPVSLQFAQTPEGQMLLDQVMQAFQSKTDNQHIILSGMVRTGGYFKPSNEHVNPLTSPYYTQNDGYDVEISLTGNFGIGRQDKDGIVQITAPNQDGKGHVSIHSFGSIGRGVAGAIYAVVRPMFRNAKSAVTQPVIAAMESTRLTKEEALYLVDLLQASTTPSAEVSVDGQLVNSPLSVKELISLFIQWGNAEEGLTSQGYTGGSRLEVEMNGSNAVFTGTLLQTPQFEQYSQTMPQGMRITYGTDKTTGRQYIRSVSFNLIDNVSKESLVNFLSSPQANVTMALDEQFLTCRIGSETATTSHPINKLAEWYRSRHNGKTLRFGNTRLIFEPSDFSNPSKPQDRLGLSGLGYLMKRGFVTTTQTELTNCRVEYTEVSVVDDAKPTTNNIVNDASEVQISVDEEPISPQQVFDDVDYYVDDFDGGNYSIQHKKAKRTIDEKDAKKRLHKIFGKKIKVSVVENISDFVRNASPYAVGAAVGKTIYLATRAAFSTEYHEAFHIVSLYILPRFVRKALMKGVRNAFAKKYGETAANTATDKQLEEFGANQCALYFLNDENMHFELRKPFDYIKQHYQAFKKVGSFRMWLLYVAMRSRVFRFLNTNRYADIAEEGRLKMQVRGVGLEHIYDQQMYDTCIKSLVTYAARLYNINMRATNIDRLDLSGDFPHRKLNFYSANGKIVGNKDMYQLVYESTHAKDVPEEIREVSWLAMKELLDNWDAIKQDVEAYLNDIGISYHEYQREVEDDSATNPDDDTAADLDGRQEESGESESTQDDEGLGVHTKASYETAHVTRASTGVRFVFSMIKRVITTPDGKQIEARNQLGMFEFMDYRDVLSMILGEMSDITSVEDMMSRLAQKAQVNKQYEQIYKKVKPIYDGMYSRTKDGKQVPSYSPENEAFITQLYNLIASHNNEFMRISVSGDVEKGYNYSTETCGEEYQSRNYKRQWGRMLMYGGTSLFHTDESGKIVESFDGAVKTLGKLFDSIKDIKTAYNMTNIRQALLDVKDEAENGTNQNLESRKLSIGKSKYNVMNPQDANALKVRFVGMLNYIGIDVTVAELDYLLDNQYGDQARSLIDNEDVFKEADIRTVELMLFFQASNESDVQQLYSSKAGCPIRKDKDGNWEANWTDANNIDIKSERGTTSFNDVWVRNSFLSILATNKFHYVHATKELSVLVSGNNKFYQISENNLLSDVVNEINKGLSTVKQASSFCYNLIQDGESAIGSIILKAAAKAENTGQKVGLVLKSPVQFKTSAHNDTGQDYYKMSKMQDYGMKAFLLAQGKLLLPTMSDKKTWYYIDAPFQLIPGIDFSKKMSESDLTIAQQRQIDQMIEYAKTERATVEQTIKQIDKKNGTIPDNEKVDNFHKGPVVTDNHGVEHRIAQGAIFSQLSCIHPGTDQEISFCQVLDPTITKDDKRSNFISEEDNLKKADKYFFNQPIEVQRKLMLQILIYQTQRELQKAVQLGIIRESNGVYSNVGLDNQQIKVIENAIYNRQMQLPEGQRQSLQVIHSRAVKNYMMDVTAKSIMSFQETQRIFSGHPGFFKYKFDKKTGKLYDTKTDAFKRFGGLVSTGTNNNLSIRGISKDKMYIQAEVSNDEVGSAQAELLRNIMHFNTLSKVYKKVFGKDVQLSVSELTTENVNKIKDEITQAIGKRDPKSTNPEDIAASTMYLQMVETLSQEDAVAKPYVQNEDGSGKIDVADGGAYMSPEMTKTLLRMCGKYDRKIRKAFKILQNPETVGNDVRKIAEAYIAVRTSVIGAQKYTAYGFRTSSDGLLQIPYYNKMALFPVFKCIATGEFAKIYEKMEKQKVDVLAIHSAVKVGGQGQQTYSSDDSFELNTYKQPFSRLRKQFNTDPHHKEDQAAGTQMLKQSLAALSMDAEYITDDGQRVSGKRMLQRIMDGIKKLSNIGVKDVRNRVYDADGNISYEKLSEFLQSLLSSRDSDISILDSIKVNKDKTGLKRCVSAMSRNGWLQSQVISLINKLVVDVRTNGEAFFQRSIWKMEGFAKDNIFSDGSLPAQINGGQPLKMINEDGPAKGAMDCVLTLDYFAKTLKEMGLENASPDEQKAALESAGIIGQNAKALFIGYRIPTQAVSSIHALRCVDVVPVIGHNIFLPKEFTRITGSDFDIDKIFIASVNMHVEKRADGTFRLIQPSEEKERVQDQLVHDYISVLTHTDATLLSYRSVDADTSTVTEAIGDIQYHDDVDDRVAPYNDGLLSTQTDTKGQFQTGKDGIGPFALLNNIKVLATLYNLSFGKENMMSSLGLSSLAETVDIYGKSISSMIGGLINIHVDAAKDPHAHKLNIGRLTYNIINLFVSVGLGKNTFYFTTQPVMRKMSEAYNNASSTFMNDPYQSPRKRQNEQMEKAAENICTKQLLDTTKSELFDVESGDIKSSGMLWFNALMKDTSKDNVLRKISTISNQKDGLQKLSTMSFDVKLGNETVTVPYAKIQAVVYCLFTQLNESPAETLSNLVRYTKIDTKKYGKTVNEAYNYLEHYRNLSKDKYIMQQIFGIYPEDQKEVKPNEYGFESISLKRLLTESFIHQKTVNALQTVVDMFAKQILQLVPQFMSRVSLMISDLDSASPTIREVLSREYEVYLKAQPIVDYAQSQGINIDELFTGNNTIYDKVCKLRCDIATDPKYSALKNADGSCKNVLLQTIIGDIDWVDSGNHQNRADDYRKDVKFVTLLNALDVSSANRNAIIGAWDQLYTDTAYPELQQFAKELFVYAFLTSGDKGGSKDLFSYAPNSIRDDSGYTERINNLVLGTPDLFGSLVDADLTEDILRQIALNNIDDYSLVPTIKLKDYPIQAIMSLKQSQNGSSYQLTAPVMLAREINADNPNAPKYIKYRPSGAKADGSNRTFIVYERVYKDSRHAIYVKVNPTGRSTNGYQLYSYGSEMIDDEYTPSFSKFETLVQNGLTENEINGLANQFGDGIRQIIDIIAGKAVNQEEGQTSLTETSVEEGSTYQPTKIKQVNFVRSEAEKDTESLYVFTDNTDRTSGRGDIDNDSPYAQKYGSGKKYPNATQAVVRGLPNAMPVSTQRWIFDHGRGVPSRRNPAPGQWNDEDIEEFKKTITEEVDAIIAEWKTGKYKTLKVGTGDVLLNGAISQITEERTPQLYAFLQSEWQRVVDAVDGATDTGVSANETTGPEQLSLFTEDELKQGEEFKNNCKRG